MEDLNYWPGCMIVFVSALVFIPSYRIHKTNIWRAQAHNVWEHSWNTWEAHGVDGGKWQGKKTSRTISFLILRQSMMDDWWVWLSQSGFHEANIEELLKARGSPQRVHPHHRGPADRWAHAQQTQQVQQKNTINVLGNNVYCIVFLVSYKPGTRIGWPWVLGCT